MNFFSGAQKGIAASCLTVAWAMRAGMRTAARGVILIWMSGKTREGFAQVIGLCADCQFMRRIESDRGSVFYQCQLSATDPKFPKYPRLPVLRCTGYKAARNLPR